jgi:hypothetical protein
MREEEMLLAHGAPLLLAFLVGLLLGLVVAGLLANRAGTSGETTARPRSDNLSGMLVLAAFTMGAFVTYVLLGPR